MTATVLVLAITTAFPPPPDLRSLARDSMDQALFEWAIGRFERADLQLPTLVVEFHDGLDECGGYYGSFTDSEPLHVDICGFNHDRFLPMPKKMILHELGHAWLFRSLDEERRQAFLELRGLRTWNDPSEDWSERGFEQAAEVMAWALLDEEHRFVSVANSQPELFADAYVMLTQTSPPTR